MTSLELNIFSPSETELIKNLLKNPDKDFKKIVLLLEKKTTESINQSLEIEEKYHSLIDGLTHLGIGIDIISEDHDVIFQNEVLKERFGDCIGKNCYRSYMNLKEPCDFCPMEEALKHNRIERRELYGTDGRTYEIISAPYPNKNGSIDKVAEVVIDITDRKNVEQILKESEEKYRYFIENSIEGLWVIDDNANTVLVNPSMAKILGYTIEEMVGESLFAFMDEEAVELTKYHLEKRKRGISEERDAVMIHKNGKKIHLRIKATPIFDAKDRYEGTYAFLTDITDQFEAEQKLKESEEKYRILTEQSLLGIFIIQKGRLKYINQALSDITGYSVEEMLNWKQMDIGKTIYHEDLKNIIARLKRSEAGDLDEYSSSIFRIVSKSGNIRWVEEFNSMIDFQGEPASLVTLIDITDKIETEEIFRTITEQSFMGIFILQDGKFKYANQTLSNITGYPLEKILNWSQNSIFRKIHPDDFSKMSDSYRRNLQGDPVEMKASQFRIKHFNGSYIWLETFSKRIEYENRPATLTSIVDISEKKLTEQKVKESEEKYRSLFENMNAAFAYHEVIVDDKNKPIDYKYIEVNPKFEELTGIKKEDLIGRTVTEAIPGTENDPADWIGRFGQVGLTGVPLTVEEYSEAIQKWFKVSGYSPKKGYFAVTFNDITDIKIAEQKLKESEEMYRNLFEKSPNAIALLDLTGKIIDCNIATEKTFGYSTAKLIGQKYLELPLYSESMKNKLKERFHAIAKQIEIEPQELEVKKKDGTIVKIKSEITYFKIGEQDYFQAIIQDITKQKEAEQKLKESEENFRTIAEDSHLAITILQDDLVVYTNQKMAEMFGYDREEMLTWTPKEYAKTVAEDSLELVMEQAWKKQIGDPDIISAYPIHCVKSSGEKFWVDNISTTIMYNGRPADLVTLVNTTEKREAELKLKESEEKFRTLTEQSFLGITILQNNIVKYVNKQLADLFGYTVEEIMNWGSGGFINVIHPEDKQFVSEQARKKQLGELDVVSQYEFRGVKKNGDMIWLEVFSKTINYKGELADFITIHDITDEKISEQKLIESEEKFRNIAEQSFMGIIILQDGIFKYFNDRISEMNGYSREEMKDWGPYEFLKAIYPEDREFVREQARKKQEGDPDVIHQYRYRTIMKNGEIRWTQIFSKSITYEGRFADLAMMIDITDKIKAEKQLKESEEKFRKITEESLLAISIIQDDKIKYVNQEMANLYGYSTEEMLKWLPSELLKTVAEESLEIVRKQLVKKQAGDPDVIFHYPIQCIKKNRDLFWVDNLSKTMMYEGRPADLVTQIDITERIKAQQELIKLNQLKSELLRRTSHELKTPLVSIKGFTELLLEVHRDKIDPVVISTLNEIMQGCIRLENLIGDILKTAELESGAIKLQKSEEDLSFLVRVCVNEIKGFSKLRNHSIHLDLKDNLMTVIEKEQIHQVISNLLNNAVKYTPPGGLIEISSEIKNNFIVLSIKDNGIGFTEEEKGMIFRQFGKIERYGQGLDIIAEGSGFGLFISKKIIELHGGEIWVESEGRNKGSTFCISLPLI
ncbi:MAG: PAS domain S-box protein [Candidatus Hermodarchaeota archaeon]